MNPNLYDSLNAFSNKTRMEIIKKLSQYEGSVAFTKILENLDSQNSSNLANHLKKLVDWNLVNKDGSSYSLTKLGRQLYDQVDTIDKLIEEHNKDIMVRTSDFCLEPFDELKIVNNLVREADFSESEAIILAKKVKRELFDANIEYLTAPLIREYTNFILLQSGKEGARHKLTRLGLPPYDVRQLLLNGNFNNSIMLYNELGKNIMEQFLLLNLLPQRFADFYLSGKIFFLHPESWALNPLEIIIPGERFSQIILQQCHEHEQKSPTSKNPLIQYLPLVLRDVIENLKNFFSGGVVITEFERVIHDLSVNFHEAAEKMLLMIIEMIPSMNIHISHDTRGIHSRTWEIWFEIDLNNMEKFGDEIEIIINQYHQDISQNNVDGLPSSLYSKPNLIINYSPNCRSTLVEAKSFSDLPELHKKILEIAPVHNISFVSPPNQKNQKITKRLLTPHLNPISLSKINESILVLDKIYVNLPKIIQISEDLDACDPIKREQNLGVETDKKNQVPLDKEKFLDTLTVWVTHTINLFEEKMAILSRNIGKLSSWSKVAKMVFDTDIFEKRTDLLDYTGTTPIYCSICLNGLKETVEYFTRFSPEKHKDSFDFLTKILSKVSYLLKSNIRTNAVTYVLSQNHFDNHLKIRYTQDSELLKQMEEKRGSIEQNSRRKLLPVYHYSVFGDHNIENLKKLAHNFHLYQNDMDLAFLPIFTKHSIAKKQILDTFKIILKNQIHSFGFSKLPLTSDGEFFRYAGSYKPLSYYDSVLQELILRKGCNSNSTY
jgi:DNA-binding HxlR family transcriptional regulator